MLGVSASQGDQAVCSGETMASQITGEARPDSTAPLSDIREHAGPALAKAEAQPCCPGMTRLLAVHSVPGERRHSWLRSPTSLGAQEHAAGVALKHIAARQGQHHAVQADP